MKNTILKKIGLRKNYYGQTKNAIIMTLFFNICYN